MTRIHTRQLQYTRQLQQYTQDNYNNSHKATTTVNTRQLQQYTQDNYNNSHKTTTTVNRRQLQQYTQDNKQQYTQDISQYNLYKRQTTPRSDSTVHSFQYFPPTHTVLTLSPQPFTYHHSTIHINVSHKVSFLPPSLPFPSLHFTFRWLSLHFTSLIYTYDFQHTLSSFN